MIATKTKARETHRCEEFWFPGCKTPETNENLFETEEECKEATRFCFGEPFASKINIRKTSIVLVTQNN